MIIDGPAGRQEVDARPSDAVNLAVVAGAPIRADSGLLDQPGATGRPEWQDYPVGADEVARRAAARQQPRDPCSADSAARREGQA